MIDNKWVAPALLLFAGAVFGRVFGVRPLVRGAMAAATMGGMVAETAETNGRSSRARKVTHRPARKLAVQKRSSKVA